MKVILLLPFLLQFLPSQSATTRANLWNNIFPQNGCKCLQDQFNVSSITLRVFDGQFMCTPVLNVDTIQAARQLNYDKVNGWVFPSPGCSINKTYDSFTKFFQHLGLYLDQVWLDIGGENVWSGDVKANLDYIHKLVDASQDEPFDIGIKTNDDLWKKITGDSQDFAKLPLWWQKDKDAQGGQDTDFKPFGGWKKADVLTYKFMQTICDGHYVGLDYDYEQ